MVSSVKRRDFLAIVGHMAIVWSPDALAQQTSRVRRVAAVPLGPAHAKAFSDGLAELGWTEGRNINTELRYVGGTTDQIHGEVAKLVALAPEVILSGGTETTIALQRITHTIPVVFVHVADPISAGLVQNLVQPGGNLTGFTAQESSIGAKWLEVLKEIAPNIGDVLVLVDPQNPTWREHLATIEAAAPSLRVQITATQVRTPAQVARAIETFAAKPNAGAIILPSLLLRDESEQIIALTNKHRLPAICWLRPFVTNGFLVSYSSDWPDLYRRAAAYVDRILRGEKPANLPVQHPVKYELVINLKAANAMGVKVPPSLLARADEVIA
jgi:putative ABC transport system substrate-binding protein